MSPEEGLASPAERQAWRNLTTWLDMCLTPFRFKPTSSSADTYAVSYRNRHFGLIARTDGGHWVAVESGTERSFAEPNEAVAFLFWRYLPWVERTS